MVSVTVCATPVSARQHLKSSTNKLHEQLHDLPAFVGLLDNTLDLPGYVAIMSKFRDFYARLDVQVMRACSNYNIPQNLYSYEPREPMFAADVLALGGDRHVLDHDNCQWPEIDSAASLAGVVYVIDGSVLGGITMNKSAAVLIGNSGITGRSYWNWCRENGLRQWHQALALVDSCWAVEKNQPIMTDAAMRTFEALNIWLCADFDNAGAIDP